MVDERAQNQLGIFKLYNQCLFEPIPFRSYCFTIYFKQMVDEGLFKIIPLVQKGAFNAKMTSNSSLLQLFFNAPQIPKSIWAEPGLLDIYLYSYISLSLGHQEN